MKRLFTILAAVSVAAGMWAQSPQKMSYQAVIRDSDSKLVTTQVGMQISILQGSESGTAVYVETQTPTPNINGLVTIEIGTGTTTDDFSAINWAAGPYFVKTETAVAPPLTTYTIEGTSQILSVPYALLAKKAESESDPAYTAWDKDYSDLTNKPSLATVATSGSYDDLSDKPSIPTQYTDAMADLRVVAGITEKVDKVTGKGLSTEDYTTAEKTKLTGIATGAEVNINADWDAVTGDAQILNKPTLATVATSGSYDDLSDQPVFVNSQWTTDATSIYYNKGKVGVGVATPSYPLDVAGDVNVTGTFRINGTDLSSTGTVTSIAAGNGMSFTTITGTGTVTLGTPSTLTNTTTNTVSGTTHTHAITTQLPSSSTAGLMLHSGTKTAGGFYGGTTAPSGTTRANYDGYLYATRFYGDGSGMTSVTASAYTGVLPVANGGTGTSTAPVQGGVVYAASASAYASSAAGTAGQVLTSNGTSAPVWSTPGTIPAGSIMIWAGSTAPTGWMLCDGTAYSTTTYSDLYAVIGTTYGSGSGTFNVHNLKGRVVVGFNSADASFDARGETGGEKTHAIAIGEIPSHTHSVNPPSTTTSEDGSHRHAYSDRYNASRHGDDDDNNYLAEPDYSMTDKNTDYAGDHTHTLNIPTFTSGSTGSGDAMNILQPYIVLNFIIKY